MYALPRHEPVTRTLGGRHDLFRAHAPVVLRLQAPDHPPRPKDGLLELTRGRPRVNRTTTHDDLGTALGIGTGIMLVTALFGLNSGSSPTSFSPRSRREEVRISFVGNAPIMLAEAATTEYASCDTHQRHGVSECQIRAPGPIERIVIAVKPRRSLECRHATPLLWIDGRPETTTLVGVESHPTYAHCIYQVRRANVVPDAP
jgi:hypothetical protein